MFGVSPTQSSRVPGLASTYGVVPGDTGSIKSQDNRLLMIAYHVLRNRQEYREPTVAYLDEQRRVRARRRALDQLRQLGYEVTLTPTEPAA